MAVKNQQWRPSSLPCCHQLTLSFPTNTSSIPILFGLVAERTKVHTLSLWLQFCNLNTSLNNVVNFAVIAVSYFFFYLDGKQKPKGINQTKYNNISTHQCLMAGLYLSSKNPDCMTTGTSIPAAALTEVLPLPVTKKMQHESCKSEWKMKAKFWNQENSLPAELNASTLKRTTTTKRVKLKRIKKKRKKEHENKK